MFENLSRRALIKAALGVLAVLIVLVVAVKAGQSVANKIMAETETTDPESQRASGLVTLGPAIGTTDAKGSSAAKTQADTTAQAPVTAPDTHAWDTEYVGPEFKYTRAPGRKILTGADFGISNYISPYDGNGDGIDDQTQLLQGAKAYLANKPQYDANSYFKGGYPSADENGVWKGVCSDVINMAFLAAGYNLHDLIEADIAAHRDDWYATYYEDGNADPNMNCRRMRLQYVFFLHHAESLTLDPYDLEAWQPGDIVIFAGTSGLWNGHIVMVSDRRAEDGVAYVLHHASTGQTLYEEDYLVSTTKTIYAHFRYTGYNGENG